MIDFADPGGEYYFGLGINAPGIWSENTGAALVNNAPAGRSTLYGIQIGGFGTGNYIGRVLAANFATLIVGGAFYVPAGAFTGNTPIMSLFDIATLQCDLRMDGNGHLFFTRNGTVIGTASTNVLAPGAGWVYIEVQITINGSTGAAQVWVNGTSWLSITGQNTQTSANAYANKVRWGQSPNASNNTYWKDMYVVDTAGGVNVTRLGDTTVGVIYPNGPGVHSQWTQNPANFVLTAAATASAGSTVYTGTITGGAANAYAGYVFVIAGFSTSANNGTFACTASSGTTLTLTNPSGVAETDPATASFQCVVQDGINHVGTWPNGDVAYIADSTTNDISDFAHQALSLTGTIFGVVHASYLRKDDAGSRQVAPVCLSSSATEVGPTVSLGNTYLYNLDVIENDPNTSAPWTVTGYNAATFGVKEIS